MIEKIGVNVRNIITLLGENLYSTPDVVVRELLQNCRDAVYERFGSSARSEGKIDIAAGAGLLEFRDNGSGMDREGLREHLSKLGTGIKRAQEELTGKRKKRAPNDVSGFIGEYGIGFFSAFMIADQITVTTQRKSAHNSYIWISTGLDEYEIDEAPALSDPGTRVKLNLQRGSKHFGDEAYIRKVVKHYCEYLDCRIFVDGRNEPVNGGRFVWELEKDEDRAKWLAGRQGDRPRHFTAGSQQRGRKRSFDYALACTHSIRRHHEIFSKRMFVTNTLQILPEPLDFLDVILNCDDLKLTLSREEIVSGTLFNEIRGELETIAYEWMAQLVKNRHRDEELAKIIRTNQSLFRQMALEEARLFQKLFDLIFFPLAGGAETASVPEYIAKAPAVLRKTAVLYVRKRADGNESRERLLLLVCEERKIPVFSIETDEDDELLRKICIKLNVQKARLSEFDRLITAEDAQESSAIDLVRSNCERFLGLKTSLSSFDPVELPFVLQGNEIVLNRKNPFLLELGRFRARSDRQKTIYTSLFKTIRNLDQVGADKLKLRELIRQITEGLADWGHSVHDLEDAEKELQQLKVGWWSGVPSLAQLQTRARPFVLSGREYSFRCFIVISFQPFYRDVVNVLVEECAKHGILAQTAGEIDSREILTKICLFIDDADFAIVDVSESNPNVLLELGIILARRKPAIIVRNTSMAAAKGVAVPADIVGIERIEYANATEDLRAKIGSVCQRIVGLKNA